MIYDTITSSPVVWHAPLLHCACLSVSRRVPYSRPAKIQSRLAKMLWCCCKVPAEEAACATGLIKSQDAITASHSTSKTATSARSTFLTTGKFLLLGAPGRGGQGESEEGGRGREREEDNDGRGA